MELAYISHWAECFVKTTKATFKRVNLTPEHPKVFRLGENFALLIPKRTVLNQG